MRNIFSFLLIFGAVLCLSSAVKGQQPLPVQQVDSLVELVRATFDVPGIAVGIVKDGALIHAKGYGVRDLNHPQLKVDENTLFGIASNSKAFTGAAIGMLVEEGRLKWDDKVTDFLPDFQLSDPYVTREFTISDLLTHRSGLGLGAGDLMMFPDSNTFSRADIIHRLRYLKPVSSFRTQYDYNNNMYIVAGEVIQKVSGMSWEEFIEQRFFTPLGMNKSAASISRVKDRSNMISAHAPVDGKVMPIRMDWSETANAAGGIQSNITDLSKWMMALLNGGQYGDGKRLFSAATLADLWAPQMLLQFRGSSPYNTHFSAYGMGWFLADVKGYKQVSHTGGLAGVVTQVTLIPELQLGIVVLTNQQSGAAFTAITNTIKDAYLGVKGQDRVKQMSDRMKKAQSDARHTMDDVWATVKAAKTADNTTVPAASIAGTYSDAWFGEVVVAEENGRLRLRAMRSPRLRGEMLWYKANTWVVKWDDRSMDADAFAVFNLNADGSVEGFKMSAISPLTDFSFDFQDLDLKRKK